MGIDMSDFVNATIPTDYSTEAAMGSVNLEPSMGSDLINNGTNMDNINDIFVIDGMPDVGAYEYGMTPPETGHDFDEVCEREDLSLRTWNGDKSSAWYLPENWTPCGVPTEETNVFIPAGCMHYPFVNTDIIMNNLTVLNNGHIEVRGAETEAKLVGN